MTTPALPSISITLAIDPPSFAPGAAVELSITAVSHASTPITIFTWPNIFNLRLAQKHANFKCVDLDTGEPLSMELTKGPKRPDFSHERGGIDDEYHITLEPGQPVKINESFALAKRPTGGPRSITPGHRYTFEVRDGEQVGWWREGRREDVLVAPAHFGQVKLNEASGEPIVLNIAGPVDFTVLASDI
jgi:hypothetical protein